MWSRAAAGPRCSLFGYPEGQRVAYAAFEAAVRSRATAGPQGSLFAYPEGQRVAYAAFEALVEGGDTWTFREK